MILSNEGVGMADSPATRVSLLVRIRDSRDTEAWAQFVEIYAPLVYGLARRHGVQDADAADLTQEVLRVVVSAAPEFVYDPGRGSFRGWLLTVARNQLRKWANAAKRRAPASGNPDMQRLLEEQPAPAEEVERWDQEYHQRLFEWAAEKVRPAFRPTTWQAFWQTAIDHQDARAVADALGLSVGAVYIARSRVLARIKEQLQQLHDD
jgi:RNA polymerase sigma factor (sigma-70 family)